MKDLYYVLMFNHLGNVKQCKTLIKHGLIKVNGLVETDAKRKITEDDCIEYQNRILNSQPFTYIMLNKPQGYICANKDEKEKEYLKQGFDDYIIKPMNDEQIDIIMKKYLQ